MAKKKTTKKIRVAINGFGRIGRQAFKIALEKPHIEVVAINDLTDTKTLAYLLQYDTVYGVSDDKIGFDKRHIIVNRKKYPVTCEPEPEHLPWRRFRVAVVLECTGRFVKDGAAKAHLKAGAGKVIISSPVKGKGSVQTFIKGVNDANYKDQEVVSNASCTTNCIAPVMRVMGDAFGVEQAFMTTIHGYTSTQNLVDGPHKDLRRGRAAAQNIVPTTTGAAIATAATLPQLKSKFDGLAIRVPVIDGSLSDFTIVTKSKVTHSQVNQAFKKAERSPLYKGIIKTSAATLVSSDIIGDPYSTIIDLTFTRVLGGHLVKILAWYDNEWGYSNRLVEMVEVVAN